MRKKIEIPNLRTYNLKYNGIDIDYNTNYPCQNGSDCCKDDYCRCGQILNTRITKIDTNKLLEFFYGKESKENQYCIERMLSNLTSDDFEIRVGGGYYGEEIEGIFLSNEEVSENIDKLLTLSSLKEKVLFILNLEYSFLLEELTLCDKWTIEEVPISLIKTQYMARKTKKKIINNYKLPLGVCLEKDNFYRLIDGHHRIENALKDEVNDILIIVGN